MRLEEPRGEVVTLKGTEMVSEGYKCGVLGEADLDFIKAEESCSRYGCTCINYDTGDDCTMYLF